MSDRRHFLKTLGAATVAAGVARPGDAAAQIARHLPGQSFNSEPDIAELAAEALQAARDAGASYADVRFGRFRRQQIGTRERQVTGVSDTESFGVGIRTLV